jgi:serine/threonine-protein kinase HipA
MPKTFKLKSGGLLEVWFHGFPSEPPCRLGRLQSSSDGLIGFEYDADFIARGREVSPIKLPLGAGLRTAPREPLEGLFGLFDDSLPDSWGRLLMDRVFRNAGINSGAITPLDRLAFLGSRTMGALTYQPATDLPWTKGSAVDLSKLARAALKVIEGDAQKLLPELVRAGGSPGGARPKFLVGYHPKTKAIITEAQDTLPAGYEPWIVKIPAHSSGLESGPVEAAYAAMAQAAGLDIMPFRLFETKAGTFFGTKRFDRKGAQRVHVHTLAGLLGIHPSNFSVGYKDFLGVTQWLTRDQRAMRMAFRQMVFNVLAHNRDDHAKNFSFLMNERGEWQLAPAYDLTFAEGPGGQHSLAFEIAGGHPIAETMVAVGTAYELKKTDCLNVLEEVAESIRQWPKISAKFGVPRTHSAEIGKRMKEAEAVIVTESRSKRASRKRRE